MTRGTISALCLSLATGLLMGGQAQAQMHEHAEQHLHGTTQAHRPSGKRDPRKHSAPT